MSNYSRGKRRYNNGYNGSYRRGRHNKNTDYYNNPNNSQHFNDPTPNDNPNKPFRILQRKQDNPSNTNIINNNNINSTIHSPTTNPPNTNNTPPRFANVINSPPINNNNTPSNDNVAAVLQNVISDPQQNPSTTNVKSSTLGHQLLSMQKRGQRLYKYKRKDGTGSAIPIPAHHKKNYNKSIGRGKKFDKEREAALQALAAQNDKPSDDNIITESDTNIAIIAPSSPDNNTSPTPIEPLDTQPQVQEDTMERTHRDTRSWRRGGGSFRNRSRGRGRGRRGRGKRYNSHYNRHRNYTGDKWSDEEDYNRDRYGNSKGNRWDKRRSKFEPPRHRAQHEWDKPMKSSDSFGSNIVGKDDGPRDVSHGPRTQNAQRYNYKNKQMKSQNNKPFKPQVVTYNKWEANTIKTDDEINNFIYKTDEELDIDIENDILNKYLNQNNNMNITPKSIPFLDVRLCPHVLGEIESQLTDFSDFLVIGVIGQQGVGKSTILSHLAGGDEEKIDENVFLTCELSKLISSSHTTHGIQCYISSERIIYLDCEPILSSSILFSLTNHRRQCMRQKLRDNNDIISPMETWDIEMSKHALFLSCICHIILVISDTITDMETTNFMRSIYALRQSMKINSFLRHDSSLRKQLKDLQMKINEKYDKKKAQQNNKMYNKMKQSNIRPQSSGKHTQQWVKHKSKDEKKQLGEEDALFYGIDESVEEDYKLFKLLNAQQRYGFPDVIFVQNKVNTFDMTPHRFNLQRKFLYTMFKHQYMTREGEVGNSQLLGIINIENEKSIKIPNMNVKESDEEGSDSEKDKEECIKEMSSKMNLFFLPRIRENNRLEFKKGCIELRNQIMSMGKPQTVSQSHSYKQTERDWFSFSKKIWHIIANAPNFIEYRGNHNHTNT